MSAEALPTKDFSSAEIITPEVEYVNKVLVKLSTLR